MNETAHLLLVDDEPLNLEILCEHLDSPRYCLSTAQNGAQAWEILERAAAPFHLIVLDRMMPVMDGMELLAKIKADARFKHLPVIMQTAAAGRHQVAEGLKQGAHYYLIKPFERDALLTIIEAALTEQFRQQELRDQIKTRDSVMGLLQQGEFAFRTLEEARQLAAFLAALCPKPEAAVVGLAELMINAVEHGNLAISYQEKTQLNAAGQWQQEIERRLQLPEYLPRRAQVCYRREAGLLRFTISDEGDGFAPESYLEMSSDRAFDSHGRGIAMARILSFSRIEYQGKGNVVMAEVSL